MTRNQKMLLVLALDLVWLGAVVGLCYGADTAFVYPVVEACTGGFGWAMYAGNKERPGNTGNANRKEQG